MNESATQIKDTTGNPAPLGLLGFGMTTVLLNFHNAGFYELNSMILAMGHLLRRHRPSHRRHHGMEKGQHLCDDRVHFLRIFLAVARGAGAAAENISAPWPPPMKRHWPSIFRIWGLFTAVMFLGTFRLNRALQVVFGTLTILFALLAIGDFTDASPGFKHFTGYEGLVCGFSAIYTGLAQILSELYGKTILPLGPVKK